MSVTSPNPAFPDPARGGKLRDWVDDPLRLAFWLLIVASLVPIWCFAYFPSQDGPSHLNNANILRLYPWHDLPTFREFYTINAHPLPNWTTHLVLAGLMGLVPALVAEKLFLSAYVISFPVAIRYCMHAINPAARAGALLSIPLIYNFLFQKGYYNFSLSIVMYFVCVGYWLRHRNELTTRRTIALAGLFLALYFCHLVSTTLACATIGLLWSWSTVLETRKAAANAGGVSRAAAWASARRCAIRTFLALLPTVLLALWYVQHQGTDAQGRRPIRTKLWEIFTSAHAHQQRELYVWIPWECCLLLLALYVLIARIRSPVRAPMTQDGLLLALALFFIIYLAVPSEIGQGGGIEPRMVIYLWLTLALWLGIQTYPRRLEVATAIITGTAALILVVLHGSAYSAIDDSMNEYMTAAPLIKRGSTLLSIDLGEKRGISFVHPFQHAASYIAVQRDIVDFTNYEATTGYFPINFLPAVNPYTLMGDAEDRPYEINIASYNQRSGRSLDYVLLWGGGDAQTAARADVQSILAQLRADYQQIYVSPQRGLVRLYERR